MLLIHSRKEEFTTSLLELKKLIKFLQNPEPKVWEYNVNALKVTGIELKPGLLSSNTQLNFSKLSSITPSRTELESLQTFLNSKKDAASANAKDLGTTVADLITKAIGEVPM